MKRIDRTAPYCARPRSRLDLVPPCLGDLGHGGDGACFVHLPLPSGSLPAAAAPPPGRPCEEECHPPHATSRHTVEY